MIPFIRDNVEPGSSVFTDGWAGYKQLGAEGYDHQAETQSKDKKKGGDAGKTLDAAHKVISLVKRLMLGTFQGRFDKKYLQRYLDSYTFRFNRRKTDFVGKRFFRLVQQVAGSSKLINTCLAPVSPSLAN